MRDDEQDRPANGAPVRPPRLPRNNPTEGMPRSRSYRIPAPGGSTTDSSGGPRETSRGYRDRGGRRGTD